MDFIKSINNLFFSSSDICLFCKNHISKINKFICKDCRDNLDLLHKEINLDSAYIEKVFFSLSYNRFIRDRVREFKFNGKSFLHKPLAEIMLETIEKNHIAKEIDLIVYVPIHKRKQAIRGYNQAELLASYISKSLKIPLSRENLVKTRWTKEQNHLRKIERMNNLKDSFKIKNKNEFISKNILLIDDIITTGVTMEECGKVMLQNGSKKVVGLAITSSKIIR